VSLNQLLNVLNALVSSTVEPIYGPPRPGDVRHSLADISRARQYLGYRPSVDLETGLAATVAWARTAPAGIA
jgi:nucleoside-diphosphate-sugar epimerase